MENLATPTGNRTKGPRINASVHSIHQCGALFQIIWENCATL